MRQLVQTTSGTTNAGRNYEDPKRNRSNSDNRMIFYKNWAQLVLGHVVPRCLFHLVRYELTSEVRRPQRRKKQKCRGKSMSFNLNL